jgi:hypothetical protein
MWYDTELFYASVLPDIERNLCDGKRRKTLRGICLHLDNVLPHNTARSQQEIARTKTAMVMHPDHSPNSEPSGFLFDDLKSEMIGFTANSPADIPSEIHQIFQEISKETILAVYDEWITLLEWITEHKGDYDHMESNKSSAL